MGTREQILEAQDLKEAEVEVPEWGVTVKVRGLSGIERVQIFGEAAQGKGADLARMYPELIIAGCLNDDGSQMFSHGDREAIGGKNGEALDRIAVEILKLSGMGERGEQEAGKG